MTELQVIEIDHSIANNFGTYIEINKDLKQYPKLYNAILIHEKKHLGGGFTLHDLKLDLNERIDNKEMLKFIVTHPRSLFQFVPFYYSRKKGFVYDANLIILYLVICSFVSLAIYLSLRL